MSDLGFGVEASGSMNSSFGFRVSFGVGGLGFGVLGFWGFGVLGFWGLRYRRTNARQFAPFQPTAEESLLRNKRKRILCRDWGWGFGV